jgi:hypothetical protein
LTPIDESRLVERVGVGPLRASHEDVRVFGLTPMRQTLRSSLLVVTGESVVLSPQ